jgi:hypothetical protein
MLSTVTWIPRGFACANPAAYAGDPAAVDGPEAAALALAQERQAERAGALGAAAGGAAASEDEAMDSASSRPAPRRTHARTHAHTHARTHTTHTLYLWTITELSAAVSFAPRSSCSLCSALFIAAAGDGDVVAKYGLQGYDQEDEGIGGARAPPHTCIPAWLGV